MTLSLSLCISDDARIEIHFCISLQCVDTFIEIQDKFFINEDLGIVPRMFENFALMSFSRRNTRQLAHENGSDFLI